MLIFDAHLDLGYNALRYNRDLRLPVATLRTDEKGMDDLKGRATGAVAFPELIDGEVGFAVATLLAPCSRPENPVAGWRSPEQAWAAVVGQLEWYREMERGGTLSIIRNRADFERRLDIWADCEPSSRIPSIVLSMEGADPLVDLERLPALAESGLRAIGPAHYGPGRFAFGTDSEGSLPHCGRELLGLMDQLDMILDATHFCDTCFWEAMDLYSGPIWASHSNSRTLTPHNRQFDDAQARALFERGSVIGVALDAWMLTPRWERNVSSPSELGVDLESVVNHIDYWCQLAGNAQHVGIGSDLDGGFGIEQTPSDLNTIADLQKIATLLSNRGYNEEAIRGILHGNFLNFLHEALL